MNTLMLVGRLVRDAQVKTLDSGKEVTTITLAINRGYKNCDGVYETDFIDCTLWDGLAVNIHEYCRSGDLIGIRGRLMTSVYEKDGNNHKVLDVVAERISFLASSKKNLEEVKT